MEKQSIRKRMRQKRESLSSLERQKRGKAICSLLEKDDVFQKAQSILFFAPTFSEPDILPLAVRYFGKKNIFFPKVMAKGQMMIKRVESLSQLFPGAFGILEPDEHLPDFSPSDLDLVLIPALAIDQKGNRLGFGGGYYDRFLSGLKAKKYVIIYDFQILDALPFEPHDVRVDSVVTEKGIFKFNRG